MQEFLIIFLLITAESLVYATPRSNDVSCAEIASVRRIPFHRTDSVNDEAYNNLRKKSWAAVPCLIRHITGTRRAPDPRSAPQYGDVRVGDVAFWVVKDIAELPYDEMFPPELVARFPKEGVYAYFEWVKKRGSRNKLQAKVREWCDAHRPKPPTAMK